MARRTRAPKLETRTARFKLAIRKKPYSTSIAPGVVLQYRRNRGAGTWGVRLTTGKDATHRLATADDYAEADGRQVLDFWQAQDAARAKAKEHEGSADPITVEKALDDYEADLTTRGGDIGNVKRPRAHLPPEMLKRTVSSLGPGELKRWRDLLAKTMAPASVNRTVTPLKAALNLAADHDDRITRRPWEIGLAAIPDAERSRNVILTDERVRAIVEEAYQPNMRGIELLKGEARGRAEKEARQWAEAFGLMVEVLAVTGARISQAARLEVADVQGNRSDPRLMMPSSKKGKGVKKVLRRPVPIPASLARRLRTAAGARSVTDALLLTKPGGGAWKKSDHSRPFARVMERLREKSLKQLGEGDIDAGSAAKMTIDAKDATIYALRHSSIVRQLLAHVPIRVVAVNHDTSVVMIERTYSRFIADHADSLARQALLQVVSERDLEDNAMPMAASG